MDAGWMKQESTGKHHYYDAGKSISRCGCIGRHNDQGTVPNCAIDQRCKVCARSYNRQHTTQRTPATPPE